MMEHKKHIHLGMFFVSASLLLFCGQRWGHPVFIQCQGGTVYMAVGLV